MTQRRSDMGLWWRKCQKGDSGFSLGGQEGFTVTDMWVETWMMRSHRTLLTSSPTSPSSLQCTSSQNLVKETLVPLGWSFHFWPRKDGVTSYNMAIGNLHRWRGSERDCCGWADHLSAVWKTAAWVLLPTPRTWSLARGRERKTRSRQQRCERDGCLLRSEAVGEFRPPQDSNLKLLI